VHQPDHPSWPAGSGYDWSALASRPPAGEEPRPPLGGGRRRRPDGVPPSFPTTAEAAPNGLAGRAPVATPWTAPGPAGRPELPRFDDTDAYANWLSGAAAFPRGGGRSAGLDPYRSGVADALGPSGRSGYGPAAGPSALGFEPAGSVGVLERTPDGYGLLTHDLGAGPGYDYPTYDPTYGPASDPAYDRDLPLDPDDDAPGRHRRTVGPRRSRRPGWVRTLRWAGAVFAVLLVVVGGVGLYQYKKLSGNITRVDALAPGDKAIRDAARQLGAENFLLIGSDTRAGANGEYGTVTGARSDTTILAHLSPNRDKATLISFPRDSWVSLPACPKTGGGTEPAHDGQFNEAFTVGGPACTVLAVQKLTGIKINHYVQVDFTGFKTMVDALDGVAICTTTPLRDAESGLRLPAGTSVLKGEQALAYVRARYGIGDGSDLGRIQRQQRFLGSMVRSATSAKLLVNPVALTKFLTAATKSLTLDRHTSFGDLRQLAAQLHGLDPKRVSFLTAPIANPAYTPPGFPPPPPGQGGSRVLLDDVAGRALYDSIINDRPQAPKAVKPAGSPKPNVLTVAPQDVRVRVLNGVGMNGLGHKVSGDLQSIGFTTVEPTNAPPTATTTVRYSADNRAAALTLAAAVPGAVLRPDPSTSLDLVVGSNYTGVKTVRVGDPATPKAASAPKRAVSSPPAVTAADARCG
jgi:LCP family protein required for cell wall assembly